MTFYRSSSLLLILLILCGTTHCAMVHRAARSSSGELSSPQLPAQESAPLLSSHALGQILQGEVESGQIPGYARSTLWKDLQQLYRNRSYRPVWVGTDTSQSQMTVLIESLCSAQTDGFHPSDYPTEKILSSLHAAYGNPKPDLQYLAQLDLLLTYTLLDYGYDLSTGRLDPSLVAPNWHIHPSRESLSRVVHGALQEGRIDEAIQTLRPSHPEYDQLRKALAIYEAIAQQGGWPQIEKGGALKGGDRNPRVIALRKRLATTGDLTPRLGEDDSHYDEAVATGVASFQERHGLKADGVLGPATLKALNVPVEDRILQIKLNMERWRWLPRDLGERYLLVNIPDFQLHAYEKGVETLTMAVVVGQEFNNRATPAFSGSMESVVFSPYWNVPTSIARKEILPKVQEDPEYLEKHNYEMTSRGLIRQRPGPGNALGLIKFLFPNEFSIYLHDTPKKHLFKRHSRAYSHGCIRVQKPVELAMYVFNDESTWTEKRIRRLMHGGRSQSVRLPKEVPVYILYLTTFVRDGRVHFREDLYGQDKVIIETLRDQSIHTNASHVHHLCQALNETVKGKRMSHGGGHPMLKSGL
jgi:L,D-transpeptidase YcbB